MVCRRSATRLARRRRVTWPKCGHVRPATTIIVTGEIAVYYQTGSTLLAGVIIRAYNNSSTA